MDIQCAPKPNDLTSLAGNADLSTRYNVPDSSRKHYMMLPHITTLTNRRGKHLVFSGLVVILTSKFHFWYAKRSLFFVHCNDTTFRLQSSLKHRRLKRQHSRLHDEVLLFHELPPAVHTLGTRTSTENVSTNDHSPESNKCPLRRTNSTTPTRSKNVELGCPEPETTFL